MPNDPIIAEPTSAAQSAALSLGRHVLTALGAYAIAKGWLDEGTLNAIIALSAAAIPGVFGVWRAYQNAKAIKTASPLVPNSIIGTK